MSNSVTEDPATDKLKIAKLLKRSGDLEFSWEPDNPDEGSVVRIDRDRKRILFQDKVLWPLSSNLLKDRTAGLDVLPEPAARLVLILLKQPDLNHWGHALATVSRWASARKLCFRPAPAGNGEDAAEFQVWTRKDRKVPKPMVYPKGSFDHVEDWVPDFEHPKWQGFFRFLKLRMEVWHRKEVLKQDPPWTEDPALQQYFFTNVYRELDRNTRYELDFLDKEPNSKEQLRKILVFRQHNSPWVFELMMEDPDYETYNKEYEKLHKEGRGASRAMIINTPRFESVQSWSWTFFRWVDEHIDRIFEDVMEICSVDPSASGSDGAKKLYDYFMGFPRIGNFFAYEFYTSLTYTSWTPFTEDCYVWCGPGAAPALEYMLDLPAKVLKRDRGPAQKYVDRNAERVRQHILDHHSDYRWIPEEHQPKVTKEPYKFTKRTFEHALCEYRKWVNTSDGGKRCRRRPYPRTF